MKKKILGEWYGTKSIPLLASGECRLLFREDGTAKAEGKVKVLGEKMAISTDSLSWEHCGENRFSGTYGTYRLEFILDGSVIKTTVNPYRMGAVSNPRYDMNIPLEMKRIKQ